MAIANYELDPWLRIDELNICLKGQNLPRCRYANPE